MNKSIFKTKIHQTYQQENKAIIITITYLNIKFWHTHEGMRYVCQDTIGGRWVVISQRGIGLKFQPVGEPKRKRHDLHN